MLALKMLEMKIAKSANSIKPDEAALNEPLHHTCDTSLIILETPGNEP